MLVNLAGCDVVIPPKSDTKVSFVVSKIQIGFTTIIQDETFSVPFEESVKRGREGNGGQLTPEASIDQLTDQQDKYVRMKRDGGLTFIRPASGLR
jgi:hypothetical protein